MSVGATAALVAACGGRTPTDEYLDLDRATGGQRSGGTGGLAPIGGNAPGGTGATAGYPMPTGGFPGGSCPVYDFADTVPNSIRGSTVGGENHASPHCGAEWGSPDAPVTFTAPFAGQYVFDTIGSELDTVLSVYDGYCAFGTEFGCNDDTIDLWSQVVVQLGAGQTVTAVVDGFGGNVGEFVLNVKLAAGDWGCPDAVIGAPTTIYGSTYGQDANYDVSCNPYPAPTYTVLFAPDTADMYTIDTYGSDYDTVLAVLQGSCSGAEIACNDDAGPYVQSLVNVSLAAGEPITILVSGYYGDSGNFVLNVNR